MLTITVQLLDLSLIWPRSYWPSRLKSTLCGSYNGRIPLFPSLESNGETSNCLVSSSLFVLMRSHAVYHIHMTNGGIDDESVSSSDRLPRPFFLSRLCISQVMCWQVYLIQPPNSNGLIPLRLSAFKPPKDRLLLDWFPSKAGRNAGKCGKAKKMIFTEHNSRQSARDLRTM